jgi:hypothetical protein
VSHWPSTVREPELASGPSGDPFCLCPLFGATSNRLTAPWLTLPKERALLGPGSSGHCMWLAKGESK